MRGFLCAALLVLLSPSAHAAALPGDSAAGKHLHDANCMGCHDAGIYTRKDHLIRSLEALKTQLSNCSHAVDKQFSATETQDLIKYLNDEFYKFQP
jgi:hypothetical protein